MKKTITTILVLSLGLSACNIIIPKERTIKQGNEITVVQVQKVKVGMSRAEVKKVLGSPVLNNVLEKDRWEYVTIRSRGGKVIKQRKAVIVFNKQGRVTRILN